MLWYNFQLEIKLQWDLLKLIEVETLLHQTNLQFAQTTQMQLQLINLFCPYKQITNMENGTQTSNVHLNVLLDPNAFGMDTQTLFSLFGLSQGQACGSYVVHFIKPISLLIEKDVCVHSWNVRSLHVHFDKIWESGSYK